MTYQTPHHISSLNRSLFVLSIATLITLLLSVQGYAQSSFSFLTEGPSGNANSSAGLLRGGLQFNFDGHLRNGQLNLYNTMVSKEVGRGQFYRVVFNYRGSVNGQGKPMIRRSETSLHKIIIIENLPAVADFTYPNTNDNWIGVARVELRFAKYRGVTTSFRVDFSPTRKEGNPPQRISGFICDATVSAGSNLNLQ